MEERIKQLLEIEVQVRRRVKILNEEIASIQLERLALRRWADELEAERLKLEEEITPITKVSSTRRKSKNKLEELVEKLKANPQLLQQLEDLLKQQ